MLFTAWCEGELNSSTSCQLVTLAKLAAVTYWVPSNMTFVISGGSGNTIVSPTWVDFKVPMEMRLQQYQYLYVGQIKGVKEAVLYLISMETQY